MADNWYILRDGKRYGPYAGAELKKHAATGHLLPIDLVVKDGMAKPAPAAKVKGLFPAAEPPPPQPEPDDFAAATEPIQPATRRTAARPSRTKLYLALGGCGLLAVIAVIMVVALASGRKPTSANGPDTAKSGSNTAAAARQGIEGRTDSRIEVKVDLPDFSKVDYSFDTSKADYTKGPQGQKIERRTKEEDGGTTTWQEYKDPEGTVRFHGPSVQMRGGKKIKEMYFFAGLMHGPISEWYDNGQKQYTGVMKDGKQHGKLQQWWKENGNPLMEGFYLNGVKHGLETNWFTDGTKKEETSFVEGVEHGRQTTWWENGKKAAEIHIKHGTVHGPATWWNKRGTVSMRLSFRDGKTSYDPASSTVDDFKFAWQCLVSVRATIGSRTFFRVVNSNSGKFCLDTLGS